MSRKILIYVTLAVIAMNLIIVAVVFLGDDSTPRTPLPNPNGYDDFVKAGAMLIGNPSTNDTMSKEELDALIATNADALKSLNLGLSRECREPVEYSDNYIEKLDPELGSFNRLLFLFCAQGRLAELDGRTNDAASNYLDGIRFGQEIGRGGLLISELVSTACENTAMKRLQRLTDWVTPSKCREIAAGLEKIDDRDESIADMLEDEKLWSQKTYGLRGRLVGLLMYKDQANATARMVAKIQAARINRRRTMIAFAARAYELEQGHPPQSMTNLAPDYLKAIPKDPATGKDLSLGR